MESVNTVASIAQNAEVVFLVLVFIFELIALFWKKRERLFGCLSLVALLLLAGADLTANKYNDRKDALYEGREQQLNQKLQGAVNGAQAAQNRANLAQTQIEQLRQQNLPRGLTKKQISILVSMLKPAAPQKLYFSCSPDPESQRFFKELSNVLASAGWKLMLHPYNWGFPETYPVGLEIYVSDLRRAPYGAYVLQKALTKVGYAAPGVKFVMLGKDEFALYVGPKPSSNALPVHGRH